MDNQNPTAPAQTTPIPAGPSFPSVGQLFKDSWQTFIHSALQLFLLNIAGAIIGLAMAAVVIVIFLVTVAGTSSLQKDAFPNLFASPQTIIATIIVALIFILIGTVISSALQISSILIVDNPGATSLIGNFKKSLGLIIPLFLTSILTFFLTFGAFFVLILPALLFYFLLSFVQFEVILNNQKGLNAIKRSVLLVNKNFGAIFIRLVLIVLIYLSITIIISILNNIVGKNSQWVVSIFSLIVNGLWGWFALAYTVTLYKQARTGLEQEPSKGILWMWVIAIIGWIIATLIFFTGYKVISAGILKNLTPPVPINQNMNLTPPEFDQSQFNQLDI